ncbi:MAG: AAA family ATPase [Methanophagales archaeon]|nr:AAA family ATPase [Methanophagales archaeon]MCW7073942.1 AAA family ATPase [Methanophagales archaeon]
MIIDNVRKANMHEQKLKIAVGGKGGVGKTTVAGTLARLIAKEGHRVIAVDADPAMNLRFALGIKTNPAPVSDLKDLIYERTKAYSGYGVYKLNPKVDDIIDRYGAIGPDGVVLVVMGTVERGGSGCICPESAFLRALLRHVIFRENMVIMDMEAGIEHLGRGTASGVDLMLTVVEPGMRSVETVGRIKKLGEDIGINRFAGVINKATDSGMVAEIKERLKELGIPLLGVIPYDRALIEADMEGKAPVDKGGAAIEQIKEIKDRIIKSLSSSIVL